MKLTLKNVKGLKNNATPLQKRVINYIADEWSNYDDKKNIFTDVLHNPVRSDSLFGIRTQCVFTNNTKTK